MDEPLLFYPSGASISSGSSILNILTTSNCRSAVGISLAIVTCASTSGGHFNPAITIALALWQGFPWKKVPYFIFSQIFGAFIAGMLVMVCHPDSLLGSTINSKAAC